MAAAETRWNSESRVHHIAGGISLECVATTEWPTAETLKAMVAKARDRRKDWTIYEVGDSEQSNPYYLSNKKNRRGGMQGTRCNASGFVNSYGTNLSKVETEQRGARTTWHVTLWGEKTGLTTQLEAWSVDSHWTWFTRLFFILPVEDHQVC